MMTFAPYRLLERWAKKGRVRTPDGSRYTDGLSRRAMLSMSLASLVAAQTASGTTEANAGAWLRAQQGLLPPAIPTLYPAAGWSNSVPGTPYYSQDMTTVFGSGWPEVPVANFDLPDNQPIDAPTVGAPYSNVITIMASTGDTSGAWMGSIQVSVGGAAYVALDTSRMQISPRTGAIGFPFSVAQTGAQSALTGLVTVTAIIRPVNGMEKVINSTFLLDHFGNRPIRYVDGANGTDSVTGSQGQNRTTGAWKTIAYAESHAPTGAIVKAAAFDYRVVTRTGSGQTSLDRIVTIQADDGVDPSTVIIGMVAGTRNAYSTYAVKLLYKNLTMDWSGILNFSPANAGNPHPHLHWQNCRNVEAAGSGNISIPTPLGEPKDPSNGNVSDPDGGYGYFTPSPSVDPTQPFYTNSGCWYAMMNCNNSLISGRGIAGCIHFQSNNQMISVFDAVYVGGGTSRGFTRGNGLAGLDSDNLVILNQTTYFPGFCPFIKERYHDKPTLRVLSINSVATSGQPVTWQASSSNNQSFTNNTGTSVSIITFDNQVDGTTPVITNTLTQNSDNVLRFITDAYGQTAATIYNNIGLENFGFHFILIGVPYGGTASSGPVTIGGAVYQIAANQCIVAGDATLTAAKAGSLCQILYKGHTDSFQTGQLAVTSQNFDNWTIQGYNCSGNGFGNLLLFQPLSSAQQIMSMTVDISGNYTVSGNANPLIVGDSMVVAVPASPQFLQGAFVTSFNSGTLTGTLSRPYTMPDGVTPVALTSATTMRSDKSIMNCAFINVRFAGGNIGQTGGGLKNFHMIGCTFVSFVGNGGSIPLNCLSFQNCINYSGGTYSHGGSMQSVVLRENLFISPTGTGRTSITSPDTDPRQNMFMLNNVVTASGGYPSQWNANDNGSTSTAIPGAAVTYSDGSFKVQSGTMTRTVAQPTVPFDANGFARTPIAFIGAVSA